MLGLKEQMEALVIRNWKLGKYYNSENSTVFTLENGIHNSSIEDLQIKAIKV